MSKTIWSQLLTATVSVTILALQRWAAEVNSQWPAITS